MQTDLFDMLPTNRRTDAFFYSCWWCYIYIYTCIILLYYELVFRFKSLFPEKWQSVHSPEILEPCLGISDPNQKIH